MNESRLETLKQFGWGGDKDESQYDISMSHDTPLEISILGKPTSPVH